MSLDKHKRETRLEEALFKIHLDIDHDNKKQVEAALESIRKLTMFITGQSGIEGHDVSLVVNVMLRERNKPDIELTTKRQQPPKDFVVKPTD